MDPENMDDVNPGGYNDFHFERPSFIPKVINALFLILKDIKNSRKH